MLIVSRALTIVSKASNRSENEFAVLKKSVNEDFGYQLKTKPNEAK